MRLFVLQIMSIAIPYQMSNSKKEATITETVALYGKKLFSFIRQKVKSIEDAEDILQDVWYQFSNMTDLNELANVSSWLYAVSRNKIIDLYRKKKTDHLEDLAFKTEEGDFEIKDILLLDDSNNPELTLFKDMIWEELFKALEELPENQKQVFIKNEIEDKTLQEIANEQNENIKTIISRKGYAVKHLRKRLLPLYKDLIN